MVHIELSYELVRRLDQLKDPLKPLVEHYHNRYTGLSDERFCLCRKVSYEDIIQILIELHIDGHIVDSHTK